MEINVVTIEKLAWMSGRWVGQVGEDAIEEMWSSPEQGTMTGAFRWIRDDKVFLYELMVIETEPDHSLVMRLKHFNVGLIGWEERDQSLVYPVEKFDSQTVSFVRVKDGEIQGRLVYQLVDSDHLTITLYNDVTDPDSDQNLVFKLKHAD